MKIIDPINYISIDLEFNTIDLKTTNIIQVGIAVGNISEGVIKTQSWFVDSKEPLSEHIIALTGITESDISNATSLEQIALDLQTIIDQYKLFVNPVQWGFDDTDALKNAFKNSGIHFPCFGRRTIDVKQIFTFIEMTNGRSVKSGLKNSMNKYKIKFEGKPHRADIDAKNTLIFFFELLKRQRRIEESIQMIKDLKI